MSVDRQAHIDFMRGGGLHPVSFTAFYVDPGSGSMILQLLLGGVSGIYVMFRLFKQKILKMLGFRNETGAPAATSLTEPLPRESHDSPRRSA
jgi:hypothetical protein